MTVRTEPCACGVAIAVLVPTTRDVIADAIDAHALAPMHRAWRARVLESMPWFLPENVPTGAELRPVDTLDREIARALGEAVVEPWIGPNGEGRPSMADDVRVLR